MPDRRGRPMWLRLSSRAIIRSHEKELEEALACGDISEALRVLEILASRYCWHKPVEKLLFYRVNRPKNSADTIDIFKAILVGSSFRRHHRVYALVSLAYLAVKNHDVALARECQMLLCRSVSLLESDPRSFSCRSRNRENRLKQLVSTKTALLHLALLLGERESLSDIGLWAHNLLLFLDFDRINADAALRMMSNFSRCLALYALTDLQSTLLDLHQLMIEARRSRHLKSRAQEDHLGFIQQIVRDIETGTVPRILTVDSPGLSLRLNDFWLDFRSGAIAN